MDDGSSHYRAHAEDPEDPEEFLHGVIRGEITYVPPLAPEYAGVDLEDLGADEDDVDSWMNTQDEHEAKAPVFRGRKGFPSTKTCTVTKAVRERRTGMQT
jgi:hypothetical protein